MCSCFDGGTQMVDISAQVPVNADLSILCDLFVRIEPGDFNTLCANFSYFEARLRVVAHWWLWGASDGSCDDDQLMISWAWPKDGVPMESNGPQTQAVMFQVAIVSTCFNMFQHVSTCFEPYLASCWGIYCVPWTAEAVLCIDIKAVKGRNYTENWLVILGYPWLREIAWSHILDTSGWSLPPRKSRISEAIECDRSHAGDFWNIPRSIWPIVVLVEAEWSDLNILNHLQTLLSVMSPFTSPKLHPHLIFSWNSPLIIK